MFQSTYNDRTTISDWACQDVDELYEKISKVGSGTYGEVNKARLKSDPSKFVALKKIKDQSETQGFPITAMREINLLQQCDHPNIIRLLNVVSSNLPDPDCKKKKKRGSTFLVFEYMEHELLGLIQTHQFSPSQVKCILKQLLEGLHYIHSKNIVHRDIKSANILMNNQGEVKIADFGLARKVCPNFSGKLTQRVVTRWYRAPELLLGCKKYSSQIDIWALGCVFAELLMGKSHALFPAQKTPDQFALICETCGIPTETEWPGHKNLPYYSNMVPKKNLPRVLAQYILKQNKNVDRLALDLLDKMLTFNPDTRITTLQALEHPYFSTTPLPCEKYEMPKFDKDCHAYVLNLKRKARANVNVINTKNTVNEPNIYLNKITTIPNQSLCQPNMTFYDPIGVIQGQQTKNLFGQQNILNPISQVYNDNTINNINPSFGPYMSQSTSNLNNMKPANGLLSYNQLNNISQLNDISTFNNVNTLSSMSNVANMGKMGSMHSTNISTYPNSSNLDTNITNMTNMNSFNEIGNMSNLSNLSNLSNISNISNMSNLSNATHTTNNSMFAKQNGNCSAYNFTSAFNTMPKQLINYLFWMNYPIMPYKLEQDLNATFSSMMNNNRGLEPETSRFFTTLSGQDDQPKPLPTTQKPKAQSRRSKQNNANKINGDMLDDKKVLETLNELDFDFLDFYKSHESSLNCKRKGSPGIQDLDQFAKKRQLNDPLV